MAWRGSAFLIIANAVAPAALADYEAWHSVEHVPERLTMPGFLGARRFACGDGGERQFLTLYDLDDTSALDTPGYRHLLANPTPASRRMRPLMRGFRRLVYRETARSGSGLGSHLGFLRWRPHDGSESSDTALLASLGGEDGIVALRVGASHETEAHPAFASDPALSDPHHAVLLSATSEAELRFALGLAVQLSGPTIERGVYGLIPAC